MIALIFCFFLNPNFSIAGDPALTIGAGVSAVSALNANNGSDENTCPTNESADTDKDSLVLENELRALAPPVPDYEIKDALPLSWETDPQGDPEHKAWSRYTFSVVNSVLDDLNKAKDITRFCPKYNKLNRDQQVQVWSQIFAGISYYESDYDPLNNTLETMADAGTDGVTHKPVYSTGLLQLSYQDSLRYKAKGYCDFDYEKDKTMSKGDLHRTLYNPYNNLHCGIHIMASNMAEWGKIVSRHYYWSTLQKGNWLEDRHGQIERKLHKQLPFCGGNPITDFLMGHTIDPAFNFVRDNFFNSGDGGEDN